MPLNATESIRMLHITGISHQWEKVPTAEIC